MAQYLVLPKIGMNMEDALISEWLVKPGDYVEKDTVILQAETDKAIQDIQATASGVIRELLVDVGDIVPCQGKLALLEAADDADSPVTPVCDAPPEKKRISPLAKKVAAEMNVPLETLTPAEPDHRIVKADVLRCAQAGHSNADSPTTMTAFSPRRNIIAKRMRESVQQKPRVSLMATVDCEALCLWRSKLCEQQKLGFNELIAKACAEALRHMPEMNLVATTEGYQFVKNVHVGIAVDAPDGLVVPVIHNVDAKGVYAIGEEFAALVARARAGKSTAEDLCGGTITISNLGMYGVESFDPIVNPPECLILGVGCMKEVPAVVDHTLCIRKQMQITLCFDHAVFDGASAARLLREIKTLLELPAMMLA